jgi:hypothetical protein
VALVAYVTLAVTTVREVGLVGEVAAGWALPRAPVVMVSLDPPIAADAAGAAGPLRARRTRPTESLQLGDGAIPLAVNAYTGGPADWPARAATAVFGGLTAGRAVHLALGALLIALAHRFLRFHASATAAGAAALVLATDWSFVFYRKVLGGTEILLGAAGLLVLWALWSRRWRGGAHGAPAIALGVGLGLLAKATFVATMGAIAATALLRRKDRPPTRPPAPVPWLACALIVAACIAPLAIAAIHAAQLPADTAIPSHDTLGLQLRRLAQGFAGERPAREGLQNLAFFFGDPLAFFADAYGAARVPPLSSLRLLGFGITGVGVWMSFRDAVRSPTEALLRFLAVAAPLQVIALFLANRDLHHLAQATVPLALLIAMSAERVASAVAPPRSLARAVLTCVLVLPHVAAGVHHLRETDPVIASIRASTFTERGQAAIVRALRDAGVQRVVTSDYELYGMLEARAPELDVVHTWGAVARGANGADVLRFAKGAHYLSVRASAPMVYNWSPDAAKVARAAAAAGVRAVPEVVVQDGGERLATLWKIEATDP